MSDCTITKKEVAMEAAEEFAVYGDTNEVVDYILEFDDHKALRSIGITMREELVSQIDSHIDRINEQATLSVSECVYEKILKLNDADFEKFITDNYDSDFTMSELEVEAA